MKSDDTSNARVNQIIGAKGSDGEAVKSFDDFIALFEDLFKRTISAEDKKEEDFAPEYAKLVLILRDFVARSKATSKWNEIFLKMQAEIGTFKKPLKSLDQKGECWKYVREI